MRRGPWRRGRDTGDVGTDKGDAMNPAHLVCANCAHPVSEGRCPVCRSALEQLRHERGGWHSPLFIAVLTLVVVLLAIIVLSM